MTPTQTRPFHLTLMSLAALLWYVALALDYVAARYSRVAEMPALPEGMGLGYEAMPLWAAIATGAAVWLGLFAAILLLLRDRMSVLCFAFSFIAAVVAMFWVVQFSAEGPREWLGIAPLHMVAAQVLVPFLLWLYARSLKQRGVFD